MKKICAIRIFSSQRVSYYSSIRKFEVKKIIEKISRHATSSSVTNLSELLYSLSSTIICRIAFGKSYENDGNERSRFHEMLHEFQALFAEFFFSDYIPFTGWIDKLRARLLSYPILILFYILSCHYVIMCTKRALRGLHGRVDRIFKEFDEFSQEIIDEHLDPNRQQIADDEEDIVDILLQLKKKLAFIFF
ncbi:unnamed protein product [Trifolium pratense]|uniref:Uncharacterized protein n=1 Tax=Trifolium pratense TaxID=57577 RepID=A0ACB0KGS4_TRIPR|nr:unnamed protein product [Trifolium pratense]